MRAVHVRQDAEEWEDPHDFFTSEVEPRLVEFARFIARREDVPADVKAKFADMLVKLCCEMWACSGAVHDCAEECPVGVALAALGFWDECTEGE